MDWINIIQNAIKYIEAELSNHALSPKTVAKQIHISESHFTRAFYTLTGYTLSEYIRNRRLTFAAELIKTTDLPVLDIAHNVGYESPEAFSKAFKRFHGVNPSESKDAELKDFYTLQIKLVLTQERPLKYSIENKGQFYLCGKIHTVSSSDSNATAYLWAQCETQGYLDQCYSYEGYENIVGVSTSEGYTVKAMCNQASSTDAITIPTHKWAVFSCEGLGTQGILKTWAQIYSSWMPRTEYEIADLPQLEVYYITDNGYTCEIWVAVN